MKAISLKSDNELKIMAEGGSYLAEIKEKLKKAVKPGVKAEEIESLAVTLINKAGGKPSFKMVPGYNWATCINVNSGIVHGIPKNIEFKKEDLISIDVGLFYKGFHTDTSFTVYLGSNPSVKRFLETGKKALNEGIKKARAGNKVGDISRSISQVLGKKNYEPIRSLTGHGIGRQLHEDPRIPCIPLGSKDENVELKEGLVLAIEVMYALDSGELILGDDGWTISTKNGKISALFEETVAVTKRGPIVLTVYNSARSRIRR